MAYPHFRSQFGDTTHTKMFVGGLAWETPTEEMRRYFEQFGEILEAVIILDKTTGKSKGYGFVTFRDPESARRACADPNPVIDGRRANCNIAVLGRPRPSPPRGLRLTSMHHLSPPGRQQGGSPYQQGGGEPQYSETISLAPPPPPPPLPPPIMYPHYGYPPYVPDFGYHQAEYNTHLQRPQYFQQYKGGEEASPYLYGYSIPGPRGAMSSAQAHRSYVYYPPPPAVSPLKGFSSPLYPPPQFSQPPSFNFPSTTSSDSQTTEQHNADQTEATATATSEEGSKA